MTELVRQLRPAVQPANVVEGKLLGALCELGGQSRELLEVSGLVEDDLHDPRVRFGWRIVKFLVERNRTVTADTVHSAGKSFGFFSNADATWLDGLVSANTLNRDTFAQLAGDLRRGVLGRAIAEKLEATARDLRSGSFSAASVAQDLVTASDSLSRSDIRGETAATDVLDLGDNWERREKSNTTSSVLTRIKLLDEATSSPGGTGGIPPKFGVIMGKPGVGKNMFLAGMLRAQLEADPDLQIGGFFLEDGSRWLLKRWVALDLGIPLGNVGVSKRTDEQMEKLTELNSHYFKLLERVHCYRYRRIRPAEALHVARVWIHQKGVRQIVLDNLTHLDHRPPPFGGSARHFANEKRNEAVAEAAERFAELADTKEIPFLALAHTVRFENEKQEYRPPRLSEVADSAGIDRCVRFAAGLWRTRSHELRLTIQKNTEGPGTDTTIELERIVQAATIDPFGGRVVNLEQEAREERENREATKESEKEAKSEATRKKKLAARARDRADMEAEKAALSPPQLSLIAPSPANPGAME